MTAPAETLTGDVQGPISHLGRHQLEAEVKALRERCTVLATVIGTLTMDRDRALAHETEVQARCTELLTEVRALRPLKELASFAQALNRARELHVFTPFEAVSEEYEEVIHAAADESWERVHSELMDLAVVAWRAAHRGDDGREK